MKKILLFICLLPSSIIFAQTSEVEDELKILIADEEYDKCASKAEKYMDKKYKNDPVVYIYASIACLRISQNYELREEYPKAFKDALKYAAKYRRKDDEGSIYNQYISHFEEMKKIIAEEVENYLLEDEKTKMYKAYKKSSRMVEKITDMDPNDRGALLLLAVLEIGAKNYSEGKSIIKDVLPEIKKIKATRAEMAIEKEAPEEKKSSRRRKKEDKRAPLKSFDEMTEMEQIYLRKGLITYANYLFDKDKLSEAKEVIEIGKPFFYNENELFNGIYNTKYKAVYGKING
jgi:hypothetical protein